MVHTEKITTVKGCDFLLKELWQRYLLVLSPRSKGGVMDDIDAVLDRRLELSGSPKTRKAKAVLPT